jgi:hypothetical protein
VKPAPIIATSVALGKEDGFSGSGKDSSESNQKLPLSCVAIGIELI